MQKWRMNTWREGHHSMVTIMLVQASDSLTRLSLTHADIPDTDVHGNEGVIKRVEDGWRRNFFDRIKMVFGYGSDFGNHEE